MRIASIRWTQTSVDHVGGHKVTPDEVEDVAFDPDSAVIRWCDRHRVYGRSFSGRTLLVVIATDGEEAGEARVITARDMTDRERRTYLDG